MKRKRIRTAAVTALILTVCIQGSACGAVSEGSGKTETKAPGTQAAQVIVITNETLPESSTASQTVEETKPEPKTSAVSKARFADGQEIGLDPSWKYADFSVIHEGKAVFYAAGGNRKGKTVAVNAGHGTKGGESKKTYSHPDKTGKVTGGTNARGAVTSMCVSSGMTFNDGTPEAKVTLRMAQILRDSLLSEGYDVLMIRDGSDVQLDNVARTVISSNCADIHIALHWDGDGLSTIKGAFYMSVPDALKQMEPVKSYWQEHERLGDSLIRGLETEIPGIRIWESSGHGCLDQDLTQTSFSTIPSVDIELGNQCSSHTDSMLSQEAKGLVTGINRYFGF